MNNVHAFKAKADSLPTIPGYELLDNLGQGGMANVYLAIQQCFGRKVALKILPSSSDDEQFRERFLREARIVAQLAHSHIIAVHDVGEITGFYYIAMDYLPGHSLKDLIRDGLSVKTAISIVKQIAEALDFAHKKGFVHRDVKPDNVLFREDGSAVLTDFGIASDTSGNMNLTQPGLIVGTPNYMSPEQGRGKPADSRSDIYSLGVMFYEMLTHRIPYHATDPLAVALKHINDPLPLLPEELDILQPIMDRLLAKSPDERYQSGRDFILDLEELSDWDIAELNDFNADDYDQLEDEEVAGAEAFEDFDDDEEPAAPVETLDGEPTAGNPFSQRDFVGFSIKFFLLVAIVIGALFLFAPDLLSHLPYYDKIKLLVESYLNLPKS